MPYFVTQIVKLDGVRSSVVNATADVFKFVIIMQNVFDPHFD